MVSRPVRDHFGLKNGLEIWSRHSVLVMLSCLACCGLVCKDNREKMGLMGPVMIRMAYMPLYIEKI